MSNHKNCCYFYRRGAEGKEDPVLKWNSRKVPDAILRARLGGWTSDFRKEKTDPSIVHHKIEEVFPVRWF